VLFNVLLRSDKSDSSPTTRVGVFSDTDIKKRYAENWDITYFPENKRTNSHFLFHYKGKPSSYAEHIVLGEVIIANNEKSEPLDRTKMLDLRT